MDYPLGREEFLKLTKITSLLSIWAHTFASGAAILVVVTLAKFFAHKYFAAIALVTATEWLTLAGIVVLTIALEIANLFVPSDRKTAIQKIKDFFNSNPPRAGGYG